MPTAWPVRVEIVKAIQTLAQQIVDDERRRLGKINTDDCSRDPVAEAFREFYQDLRKAGFNPSEPRVPSGNPDGGQWTAEGWTGGYDDPRVVSDVMTDSNSGRRAGNGAGGQYISESRRLLPRRRNLGR